MPLVVPPPLAEHRPPGFPWLGALAPVAAAAILFAVTTSPFALAFAAPGPITAVAAMIDGRRTVRKARRRDIERRETALAALALEIDSEHDRRRRAAEAELPSSRRLVDLPRPSAPLDTGSSRPLRVGRADIDSGVHLEPQDPADGDLVAEAAVLRDAPFVVDAAGGVGVVGRPALREAFAETVRAQLLWRAGRGGRIPTVAHADRAEELPEHCRLLIEVDGPRTARVLRASALDDLRTFEPELLGTLERRELIGAGGGSGGVPDVVSLLDLPAASSGGLSAIFAVGESGPVEVDLVSDGPHALVGGTTGSGKSELLVSWLLALTDGRSPDEVALLLFDFKGGAAFDPLAGLPHVRGLVTDLDGADIDRATAALGAELRSREARLRTAEARSADEMPELGRLVIVVDEFAAMLAERRELHDVFVDVAARGRSLGVHLVLCTQRPAGVVRDSLAANCALRISLRVVDRSDSIAVVGDDSAARIPRTAPGRCAVAMHGEPAFPVQVASVARDDVPGEVARRSGWPAPSTAGWLPPLPPRLPLESLPPRTHPDAVRIGLVDLPASQSQPLAEWDPSVDGALLVVGAAGSGRSTAMRTVAAELGAELISAAAGPASIERVADSLASDETSPLVIDDLDAILDQVEGDHRAALLEQLPLAIRARGRRFAYSLASPATPSARVLFAVAGTRVNLRLASADDHRAAVGSAILHDPRLRPGGGVWNGARLQVAQGPAGAGPGPAGFERTAIEEPVVLPAALPLGTLLVTTSPDARILALEAAGVPVRDARETTSFGAGDSDGPDVVTVIDPLGWQSAMALWPRIGRSTVVYDRCRIADYRSVSRDRTLPPVLAGRDRVWLARPGHPVERARWCP